LGGEQSQGLEQCDTADEEDKIAKSLEQKIQLKLCNCNTLLTAGKRIGREGNLVFAQG
jgi:hypothetical protein